MFKVELAEHRWRAKKLHGELVACMLQEKPCMKTFKERYETQAGAEFFKELLAKNAVGATPRAIPGRLAYRVMGPGDQDGAE